MSTRTYETLTRTVKQEQLITVGQLKVTSLGDGGMRRRSPADLLAWQGRVQGDTRSTHSLPYELP